MGRFISIKEYDLKVLRVLALQKPLVERENFYLPVREKILKEFSVLEMIPLIKMIFKETEPYLQELECTVLGEQLVHYIGPISLSCLAALMDIFPISVIWLLATEAKFPLIKEKAQERLNRILDQYGYQIKDEKDKVKKYSNDHQKNWWD